MNRLVFVLAVTGSVVVAHSSQPAWLEQYRATSARLITESRASDLTFFPFGNPDQNTLDVYACDIVARTNVLVSVGLDGAGELWPGSSRSPEPPSELDSVGL